jgi:DNA-directed RNA polymerase subunit F
LKMAFLSGVQEKDIFTEKAQKTLGLLLNIPDPHGTGGTTDTGNNSRDFFHAKNREAVLNVYDVSPATKEKLRTILKQTNVILRVINSSKEIHVCTLYIQPAQQQS